MNIAEKLVMLRKAKGLSRREVAEATGISENTYKKYEIADNDKLSVRPPYERLCTLADFYGVTTDYLLGREQPPEQPQMSTEEMVDDIVERWNQLPPNAQKFFLNFMKASLEMMTMQNGIQSGPEQRKKHQHSATLRELMEAANEDEAKNGA